MNILLRRYTKYSIYKSIEAMRVTRKRARDEVKSEDLVQAKKVIKSKYFKKETTNDQLVKLESEEGLPYNDPVDIDWVKSLKNKEYFEYLHEKTGEKPDEWRQPLDLSIFQNTPKDLLPDNFISTYSRIRLMRSMIKTPVDTMGCASLPLTVGVKVGIKKNQIIPKNYRLQSLLGVMLSAQTKDEVTAQAVHNIMEYCLEELGSNEGINLEALLKIDDKTFDELIYSVGFHNRKAKFIKETAKLLKEKYNSDIPTNIKDLLSLPGVGPKMGYLTMQKAWGKIDGICVDVHVHRFARLFKWVDPKKCPTPEHTRKALEKWLPHELWYEINSVLVGFGQVIAEPSFKKFTLNGKKEKIIKTSDDELITGIEDWGLEFTKTRGDYSEWSDYINNRSIKETKIKSENEDINVKVEIQKQDIEQLNLKLESDLSEVRDPIIKKENVEVKIES